MIAIVNYGMGNIRSIQNALQYLGCACEVVDTPTGLQKSKKIILPGVGSFAKAIANIKQLKLFDELQHIVIDKRVPILGICLGMQLLAGIGEEDGPSVGLGLIPGKVKKFVFTSKFKMPHIGFNTVKIINNHSTLFEGLEDNLDFYFVHNYVFECDKKEHIATLTQYGKIFVSSVQNENILGVQFHPEKSQSNGLRLLKNFINFK